MAICVFLGSSSTKHVCNMLSVPLSMLYLIFRCEIRKTTDLLALKRTLVILRFPWNVCLREHGDSSGTLDEDIFYEEMIRFKAGGSLRTGNSWRSINTDDSIRATIWQRDARVPSSLNHGPLKFEQTHFEDPEWNTGNSAERQKHYSAKKAVTNGVAVSNLAPEGIALGATTRCND